MKKLINSILLTVLMLCQYSCIDCEHTDEPVMPEEEIPIEEEVIVTTGEVSDITSTSAIIAGSVENIETLTEGIVYRGIMYNTDSIVSQAYYKSFQYYNGRENGLFKLTFDDLEPGTTYYYRSCVVLSNSDYTKSDYYYGEVKSFRTEENSVIVTTGVATDITSSSAVISGSVENLASHNSNAEIGVVYGINTALSINNGISVPSSSNVNGEYTVSLTGLSFGTTYYYCAYVKINDKVYYGELSSFTTNDEITPGQEVDLGLSVKWAGWNVGASSPEQYGGYYAWGETEEKSVYLWETYKHAQDTNGDGLFSVYDDNVDIGAVISGTQYDVAHVKWGNGWRMPTKEELEELETKCTWTDYTYNGVRGCKVTGLNGNSIFLPCAGCHNDTSLNGAGGYGYYWSGSYVLGGNSSYYLYFNFTIPTDIDVSSGRFNLPNGRSVRPVR